MKNVEIEKQYIQNLTEIQTDLILLNRIEENTDAYEETCTEFLGQKITDLKFSTENVVLENCIKLFEQTLQSTITFLENMPELGKFDEEILDACYDAREKVMKYEYRSVDGTVGAAILSVGKLINLTAFLYERYKSSLQDRAIMDEIEQKGIQRMPNYTRSIMQDLFEMLDAYLTPDSEMLQGIVNDLQQARYNAAEYSPDYPNLTLRQGKEFLKVAEYAYTGIPDTERNIVPLEKEKLPECLKECSWFQEEKGILNIPGNMKAVFAENDDKIIIGFAGTEPLNKIPTLGADIQQLVSPNLMYLRAVGIVHAFMELYESREIVVTGHSLGGGLTQMAVMANCMTADAKLLGAAFNSAGLSSASLQNAGGIDRIRIASQKITHFRSPYDLVSAVGALVGGIKLLKNTSFPYHCISNIRNSF